MPDIKLPIPDTQLSPKRITLIYFVVGSAWIILTSIWLSRQNADSHSIVILEAVKGLGFVVITSGLLWFLCRIWSAQLTGALTKYEESRSRYELYVKNSPIAISVIARTGDFLESNRAALELTGYKSEELDRMNIFELVARNDREETEKAFSDAFLHGYASRDQTIYCKDGSKKIIRVDCVRHTEEQAICFSRDITDRKHNEQRLLALNTMLRAIRRVNQAIIGTPEVEQLIRKICEILVEDRGFKHAWIALLDEDHHPLHYFDAPQLKDADKLKEFLLQGRLPQCMESTKKADGLILADKPAEQCPDFPLMEGLEECALIGIEFEYDHNLGYIVLMAEQESLNEEEEIMLFREVADDLCFALRNIKSDQERQQATKDLIQAKQAAEAADRAKSEFLSVMSHELRTPLNPIMGHSDLLLMETEDPNQRKSLQQINQSGERLLTLIDDILFFSQLQADSPALGQSDFLLLECCELTVANCQARFPDRPIILKNGIDGFAPLEEDMLAHTSREHIERVIKELLSNACKYSHSGEIHIRVGQKRLEAERTLIQIEVEDRGIGISPSALENLFDAFTQVDSSHTRSYEGIGLGLAICRKISDVLGGSLTAESQEGIGSCFRFQCELATTNANNEPTADNPTIPAGRPGNGERVLIVEDSASNAYVAQAMLKRLGFENDLAEDGQQCLQMCRKTRYDVILMDLSMPIMNGFKAASEIQHSDNPNKDTPIIGLTAHVGSDVEADCRQAGMVDFIGKPLRMDLLKESLSKHLKPGTA